MTNFKIRKIEEVIINSPSIALVKLLEFYEMPHEIKGEELIIPILGGGDSENLIRWIKENVQYFS